MRGWLRPTPGPVLLAMASGSVTPDLIRGLPTLDLGLHDRGLVSALLVGCPVAVAVLAGLSALVIPGWNLVAPPRLAGLSEALESARVGSSWREPRALVGGIATGIVSHFALDLLSHEPPPWLPGSGLAAWAPFSVGGEPYPVYFIIQFLLSVVGIVTLLAAGRRANGAHPGRLDELRPARPFLQAGLVLGALYGAFGTRIYTSQATGRSFSDAVADVGVGASIAFTLGLCLIGLGLRTAPVWARRPPLGSMG